MTEPQDQSSLIIAVATAALSLYLVPSTYVLFMRFCCTKTLSFKKQRLLQKQSSTLTKTTLHLPLTLFLWTMTIFMILSVPEDLGPINPYDILNLKFGEGSKRTIKKAYRKLSLLYHPDKQKKSSTKTEKENANAKFLELSEAYRTLSDDEAFLNYQTYGHPDGPRWRRAMDQSPLPSFLMINDAKSSSSVWTLLGYGLLIVTLPLCCICAATSEKKTNDLTGKDRKHYMDRIRRGGSSLDVVRLLQWCITSPSVHQVEQDVTKEWLTLCHIPLAFGGWVVYDATKNNEETDFQANDDVASWLVDKMVGMLVGPDSVKQEKMLTLKNPIVQACLSLHTMKSTVDDGKNTDENVSTLRQNLLQTPSTTDKLLTLDVVVVHPIVHAAKESLATLLGIVSDPKSGAQPEFVHLVGTAISLLVVNTPKREENVNEYVVAVSTKVMEFAGGVMGDSEDGSFDANNDTSVRVNDTLCVTIGLSKKGTDAAKSSSGGQLFVQSDSSEEEEDRWLLTVSTDQKLQKVLFCGFDQGNKWRKECEILVNRKTKGKMILNVTCIPLAAHASCRIFQELTIDVLEEEVGEEDDDDNFEIVGDDSSAYEGGALLGDEEEVVVDEYVDHNGVTRQNIRVVKTTPKMKKKKNVVIKKEVVDEGDWEDQILSDSNGKGGKGKNRNGVSRRSATKAKNKNNNKKNNNNKNKKKSN